MADDGVGYKTWEVVVAAHILMKDDIKSMAAQAMVKDAIVNFVISKGGIFASKIIVDLQEVDEDEEE